jgi:hypothetical protein
MLAFNNKFLGWHLSEHNTNFSGSDTDELFANNLKTQPSDWYYRTNTISYIRNKNGHRCKDIEDIDLNNYILFAGCSHSEGIGLELEKTYPYLISKSLGCDYYNLSSAGTGIDVMAHNLALWRAKVKQDPKFLIIHKPEITRFVTLENSEGVIVRNSIWNTGSEVLKFIDQGNNINFFSSRFNINAALIENLYSNSKIIRVDWEEPKHPESIHFSQFDKARDLSHAGIESNKKLADDIVAHIR